MNASPFSNVDLVTHAAPSKTTPVDADEFPLVDSAASNLLARLTWANLKATLLTWLQGTVLPAPGPIGATTPAPVYAAPIITKGPAAVTSFAGFVSTSGSSTTITFTSAADAILAGYNATNPVLGVTLITTAVNQAAVTRYIKSWTNSTACVVDTACTLAASSTLARVQLPIATFVNSAGVTQGAMLASGQITVPLGSVSAPSYSFTSSTGSGMYMADVNTLVYTIGGTKVLDFYSGQTAARFYGNEMLGSGSNFGWTVSSAPNAGGLDTNLSRGAAGKVYVGNGTQGDYTGTLIAGNIGAGLTGPAAVVHLKAGTAAASTAPLKFTTGVLQTTAEAGTCEFAGDLFYQTITTSATRRVQVAAQTGRSVGATAAAASVATFTLGAADASFEVCANVLVTTATTHSFNVTVAYTDEGNTARTLTLNFSTLAGVISNAAITNIGGAVPYEGTPLHIRCKASTAITVATVGTFTAVVYNCEANIKQIA